MTSCPRATSHLLRWPAFCLWSVYLCFHFTTAHPWTLFCTKPGTLTWWLETWDMTILLRPIFLQHLYKARGGRWAPLPSPLFLGLIKPLLTYHFASRWIPSAPRCTEPELHWILRQAVWFQLKYCGFSPIWGVISIPIPLPALAQLLPTSVPSKGLIFSAGTCFLPVNLLGQFPSSSQCQQNYAFLTAPVLCPQGQVTTSTSPVS